MTTGRWHFELFRPSNFLLSRLFFYCFRLFWLFSLCYVRFFSWLIQLNRIKSAIHENIIFVLSYDSGFSVSFSLSFVAYFLLSLVRCTRNFFRADCTTQMIIKITHLSWISLDFAVHRVHLASSSRSHFRIFFSFSFWKREKNYFWLFV